MKHPHHASLNAFSGPSPTTGKSANFHDHSDHQGKSHPGKNLWMELAALASP